MGKSKKKKNADFQKVKLKVGKTRPAGANATDTSFKTSSIHLTEQLQQSQDATTKRNLSLKDLLSQVNHYNVTTRHEALMGLKELFEKHPTEMHNHISVWLPKVLEKTGDKDPAVRHATHLCMSYAMSRLSQQEVLPFMKVIVVYICCGLTHISEDVQLDILVILDSVLDNFASIFVQHSDRVLKNFIELIAKHSSSESSASQSIRGTKVKGISSLVQRDIPESTKGHMSSLKTRTKILERVNKILHIIYKEKSVCEISDISKLESTPSEIIVDRNKPTYVQLLKYGLKPFVPVCNPMEQLFEKSNLGDKSSIMDKMQEVIDTIFPVLINCWVEYGPSQLVTGIPETSQSIALSGMNVVVNTMNLLLKLLYESDSTKNETSTVETFIASHYFKDFTTYLIHYFPLPMDIKTRAVTLGNKLEPAQQFSISFNFVMAAVLSDICEVLLKSNDNKTFDSKQIGRWIRKVTMFTQNCHDNNVLNQVNKIDEYIGVVQKLLKMKIYLKPETGTTISVPDILRNLGRVYSRASLKSTIKVAILKFFSQLLDQDQFLLDEKCRDQVNSFTEAIAQNLSSLPPSAIQQLLRESVHFVKSVLVRQLGSKVFTEKLKTSLVKITDSKGIFKTLPDDLQKRMVEIVYNFKNIPGELVKNLAYLCQANVSTQKYIISIVTYCLVDKKEPSIRKELYISFILSVVVGYSLEELKEFNSSKPNCISWNFLNIFRGKMKQIPLDHILENLKLIDGHESLWELLIVPLGKILVISRSMPVTAAVGLIKLLESLWLWKQNNMTDDKQARIESELNQIADLISSVLLYSISETYKQLLQHSHGEHRLLDESLGDDLICSSVNFLAKNSNLLQLLIQKWKHVLTEYKMNRSCVKGIMEVLVCLLQEEALQKAFSDNKPTLQQIIAIVEQVNIRISLLHDLQYHVSLL